jgi:hypothetical protein
VRQVYEDTGSARVLQFGIVGNKRSGWECTQWLVVGTWIVWVDTMTGMDTWVFGMEYIVSWPPLALRPRTCRCGKWSSSSTARPSCTSEGAESSVAGEVDLRLVIKLTFYKL